jgi:hypothetical protein
MFSNSCERPVNWHFVRTWSLRTQTGGHLPFKIER